MARKIGIDLGTTNLLICVDNKGVVVNPDFRSKIKKMVLNDLI